MKKWVCTVCGYVHEGDTAPEKCPDMWSSRREVHSSRRKTENGLLSM